MGDLRDSLALSATTGRTTTQSVEVGMRYPNRLIFINPTDPSGTVGTLQAGTLTVENAVASGDAGEYWNGTTRRFATRSVEYEADYSEYRNAPTVRLDNAVLFNEYPEEGGVQARLSAQSLVSGRNINLNLVTGNFSRSSVRPAALDINPVSAPSEPLTVTNGSSNVTLSVPTLMSEERWREALSDEGNVVRIGYADGEPYNTLTVELSSEEDYRLHASKVAVGETSERQEARYVVLRGGDERNVRAGSTERLNVEVRDRYNNPVNGVLVKASATGVGDVEPVDPTTDEDGLASFRYVAPSNGGNAGVELSIGANARAYERVNVALDVFDAAGGGAGGGDGGFDQGEESGVFVSGVDIVGNSGTVEVGFRNTDSTKEIVAAKLIGYYDSRPNCPCGDRLRVGGSGPSVNEGGPTETLNQPVELTGGTTTVTLEFTSSGGGGGFRVRDEDFALVRLEFSDGTRSTYFVQFNSN